MRTSFHSIVFAGLSLTATAAQAAPISMLPSGGNGNWSAQSAPAPKEWKLPQFSKLWKTQPPDPQIGFTQPFYAEPPSTAQRMREGLTNNALTQALTPSSQPTAAPASDSLSLATAVSEPNSQLVLSMAQFAESRGETDGARQHYQQAVAKWPHDIAVLRAAGHFEDRQSRFVDAEWLYQQAVQASPGNPSVLNDLGLCQARQGQLQQAAATLRQAIAQRPDKALYRNNLAVVLVELGDEAGAYAELAPVHGPAIANYNLGQMLAKRQDPAGAARCFQQAIAADASLEPARAALAKLTLPTAPYVAANPAAAQSEAAGPVEPGQPAEEPQFLRLLPPTTTR